MTFHVHTSTFSVFAPKRASIQITRFIFPLDLFSQSTVTQGQSRKCYHHPRSIRIEKVSIWEPEALNIRLLTARTFLNTMATKVSLSGFCFCRSDLRSRKVLTFHKHPMQFYGPFSGDAIIRSMLGRKTCARITNDPTTSRAPWPADSSRQFWCTFHSPKSNLQANVSKTYHLLQAALPAIC